MQKQAAFYQQGSQFVLAAVWPAASVAAKVVWHSRLRGVMATQMTPVDLEESDTESTQLRAVVASALLQSKAKAMLRERMRSRIRLVPRASAESISIAIGAPHGQDAVAASSAHGIFSEP